MGCEAAEACALIRSKPVAHPEPTVSLQLCVRSAGFAVAETSQNSRIPLVLATTVC